MTILIIIVLFLVAAEALTMPHERDPKREEKENEVKCANPGNQINTPPTS